MKNTDTSQLPQNIERQLSELELKHKSHQLKMEDQRLRKVDGEARHRARNFERSIPPICLV